MRRLALAFVLVATAAAAERPADTLARLRGAPSTNAGALGSAFPRQYVDAYRCAYPPAPVLLAPPIHRPGCGPSSSVGVVVRGGGVTLGGVWTSGVSGIACPAPGWPTTQVTTTTTTVTTTTTTVSGGSRVLAPALPDEPRVRTITAASPAP